MRVEVDRYADFLTEWVRKQLELFRITVEFGRRVDDVSALSADIVVIAAGLQP